MVRKDGCEFLHIYILNFRFGRSRNFPSGDLRGWGVPRCPSVKVWSKVWCAKGSRGSLPLRRLEWERLSFNPKGRHPPRNTCNRKTQINGINTPFRGFLGKTPPPTPKVQIPTLLFSGEEVLHGRACKESPSKRSGGCRRAFQKLFKEQWKIDILATNFKFFMFNGTLAIYSKN